MTSSSYEIRKATIPDAEGIAAVHVKSWQTSYQGIIEQSYLDAISYGDRLGLRKRILSTKSMLSLVVTYDERIVGFADAGALRPEPYNETLRSFQKDNLQYGEIYALYLLQDHQGKGLGHRLFEECRRWFKEQGYTGFVTWALAHNRRAKQFYEKEGGEVVGETVVTIGDKEYEEYCYMFRFCALI
jgi:GNAT superfamily N-acetyltransferase